MKTKYIAFIYTVFSVFLSSCSKTEMPVPGLSEGNTVSPVLSAGGYDGTDSGERIQDGYDRVETLVSDQDGNIVTSFKSMYDRSSSSLHIEGLVPGAYQLMILAMKGNHAGDGIRINRVSHTSEVWAAFPGETAKELEAEYFYSKTSFSVYAGNGTDGTGIFTDIPEVIVQKRIVGRVDFSFRYRNPYIQDAVLANTAVMDIPGIFSCLSADGSFSGEIPGGTIGLDLKRKSSYIFLPTAGGAPVSGMAMLETRSYSGNTVRLDYAFSLEGIENNRISGICIDADHPDDESGTMFITGERYDKGGHPAILQDDEHHSIYTDKSERSFNTAAPLQISVSQEGELHVRFYSPRDVEGILVTALIPSVCEEYIDLAYFDRIPAFADFKEALPCLQREGYYRSASGKIVRIPKMDLSGLDGISFKAESDDPYWKKLQEIRHGWNIRFDLFGGDPAREDGGPSGNWMGIRPVHCREAVALFLNFTYMIDMPEHERILAENEDRLYGNGGVNDKVSAETVLKQMRQERTINVGLVYPGNGVMGLGGGSTFGAWQGGWLDHYSSTYACEVMFHELGHVMGYNHSSSFTYGPWAQELMNNFYVTHLSRMPVDSPKYLDSGNNPNIYL